MIEKVVGAGAGTQQPGGHGQLIPGQQGQPGGVQPQSALT